MKKTRKCPLPEELLFYEILPRLPTKSLIRFKSVSKTWLSRISKDSLLIATKQTAGEEPGTIIQGWYKTDTARISRLFFLGRSESNLVEIDTSYLWKKSPDMIWTCIHLIGSCNGLVCLRFVSLFKVGPLVLWNPATREVNYLPAAAVSPGCDERDAGYALGFDAQTGVHKVVRLEEVKTDVDSFKVNAQIFSNKSERWRDLRSLPGISPDYDFEEDGLTVDGAIYWTGYASKFLSFDISKEEFRELDGPRFDGYMDFHDPKLVDRKGSLGAILVKPDRTECQFWLKNKNSNDNNNIVFWTKISTIDDAHLPVLLRGFLRDQIILLCNSSDGDTEKTILYDLVTNEKKELQGCLEEVYYKGIFEHFHTLISPN